MADGDGEVIAYLVAADRRRGKGRPWAYAVVGAAYAARAATVRRTPRGVCVESWNMA
ncbi:hypothetical protein [Streptomyces avermitilis]|uniref:hypothetical protein n=1 Tax=Streptomyces avermitilis TaxID=33903 RepID=UPI002017FCC3|nr:hypothetical protein [Streptomyces avermitilis]